MAKLELSKQILEGGKIGTSEFRHKMTQIKEYKPLENEDSEYDVRICPKKIPLPHNLFFM